MQKFKKRLKRGFAFFVVLTMCISVLQMSAFAEEQMQPGGDQSAVKQADSQESNAAESGMPEPTVGGSTNDAPAAAPGFNAGENETLTNDENSILDFVGETSAGETLPAEDEMAQADKLSENAQKFIDQVTALGKISADDKKAKQEAIEEAETLYAALTDEEKALPEVAQAYQVLLSEKQALSTVFYVGDAPGEDAVYNDTAPEGSAAHPYSSLADAVDAADKQAENDHAKKSFIFILTSNLTATKCARINGTDITIDGKGHTITRGDGFHAIQDNARSTYNPAMIEVCNSGFSKTASLRLENITLNDGGRTAGTRYSQASTDGTGGNSDTVQDAIIATYDGVGTIVLGSNTTLTGYGGMSSVRLSGGTLIMESGSTITGGKAFSTKGGGNGPAGAIWSQGGKITIKGGAEITGVMGRAMYLDGNGSEALINGTISGVTYNANMWNSSGSAVHARNLSKFVLGPTGKIADINNTGTAIYVTNSNFEAQSGSLISNINDSKSRMMVVSDAQETKERPGSALLNGTIKNCTYSDVGFFSWYGQYNIGEDCLIENVQKSGGSIGLFYLQNGGELNVRGKIQNNNNCMVYMGNQGGADTHVRVYDGGYIHGNNGYGIYANNSGQVEIYGGEISGNSSYGVYVRAKSDWKNPSLKMTGGKIINNGSTGVSYATTSGTKYSKVDITGGEISGNGSSYLPYQISISGANAEDDLSRVYIKPGIVKEANEKKDVINTSFAQITDINLGEGNEDFYIGNAKVAASDEISKQVENYKEGNDDIFNYIKKGSALWFKTPDSNLKFVATRSSSVNKALPLYVAYLPVKADGTPESGAKVIIKKVENKTTVPVELDNLTSDQSYALMWMQPKEQFGYITLDGTSEINEVLNEENYTVDYTATYTIPKSTLQNVESGKGTFEIKIKLDDRLSYDNSVEAYKATIKENTAFDLEKIDYIANENTLVLTLKVKDDFEPGKYTSNYSAEIKFTAKALIDDFDAKDISTDASVSGIVKLETESAKLPFNVELLKPTKTDLIPLPTYTVSYDFVSGTDGRELPASVYDLLPPSVTVKEGTSDFSPTAPVRTSVSVVGGTWDFAGYNPAELGEITGDVTIVGTWTFTAVTPVTPTPPTVNPPTPTNPPAPTPTPAPAAAPAVAPVAPIAAPLAQVAPAAVPLANQDAEDTREVADEQTPLAKGAENDWALLNLILMIGTVLASGLMLIFFFLGRKEAAYENSSELEAGRNDEAGGFLNRKNLFRFLSLIPAIASIIFFVLTEDMASPMVIVDKWTPWMVVFALVNVVFAILSKKKRYGSDDTQKPGYGMA